MHFSKEPLPLPFLKLYTFFRQEDAIYKLFKTINRYTSEHFQFQIGSHFTKGNIEEFELFCTKKKNTKDTT